MGLAMLGDKLSAEQAEAWGLIWKCVDDAEFAAHVDALVAQLAQAPTQGPRRDQAGAARVGPQLRSSSSSTLERDLQRELGYSDDYREGVAAFVGKRPPQFTGTLSDGRAADACRPWRSSAPARWARASRRSRRRPGIACSSSTRASTRPRRRSGASRETLVDARGEGQAVAEATPTAASARIDAVHALGDVASAKLVIEAIVEDLEAKRELFRELEVVVAADAILATNTSSLSITALAAGLKRPGRVVGMHFFNPAPVLPLVEVVSGLATDPRGRADRSTTRRWPGARRRCTRRRRRASSSTAARGRSTREALRLLAERAADAATIDARDARGRRLPHGTVRADGPDRPRRQLRGDARASGRRTSTTRASRRRCSSRSSSPPASSAARPAAASTTTRKDAAKPAPRTEPPRPARSGS